MILPEQDLFMKFVDNQVKELPFMLAVVRLGWLYNFLSRKNLHILIWFSQEFRYNHTLIDQPHNVSGGEDMVMNLIK